MFQDVFLPRFIHDLIEIYQVSGFHQVSYQHFIMFFIAFFFLYLGFSKKFESLLLIPIGFGIIAGNIPIPEGMKIGIYEEGSVLNYLYFGVRTGVYPALIFLGIGAMTDFSTLLANPKLLLLGAAAQFGIFITLTGALALGFTPQEAGAIGIIGGADGPTSIFLTSKLAPHLLGIVAIAAYSYTALIPVIQPPIMKLLTTREERRIRMKPSRNVSQREKIIFPIVGTIVCCFVSPGALVLLGMLFFGNLLKECGVAERLAATARTSLLDIVTIILGFSVGASTQAVHWVKLTDHTVNRGFLTPYSLQIFFLGAVSFAIATASGVIFAKIMNLFLPPDGKINPLIGAAGVSAVPGSARVVQHVGHEDDPHNYLLMHAMAPNVAGVIGSAITAGILLSKFATH